MKLYTFFEYTDSNSNNKYTNFNENEIKYLKSKGNLDIISSKYTFELYVISKLVDGEYLVNDKIKCSTIQSLVKYILDIKNKTDNFFESLLANTTKKKSNNGEILWYIEDTVWAIQDKKEKSLCVRYSEYWKEIDNISNLNLIGIKDYIIYKTKLKNYIIFYLNDYKFIKYYQETFNQ